MRRTFFAFIELLSRFAVIAVVLTTCFLGFIVKLRQARRRVSHHCNGNDDDDVEMHINIQQIVVYVATHAINGPKTRAAILEHKFQVGNPTLYTNISANSLLPCWDWIFMFRMLRLRLSTTNRLCVCFAQRKIPHTKTLAALCLHDCTENPRCICIVCTVFFSYALCNAIEIVQQ